MRCEMSCDCCSRSLCSTMPSFTTAATRSSRTPEVDSSSADAAATASSAHDSSNRTEKNRISAFGVVGDGGVSPNRAPQESLVVDSDTRKSTEFQLQADGSVGVARATANEVPPHQAQRPAAGAVLEAHEPVQRLVVPHRVDPASEAAPAVAHR